MAETAMKKSEVVLSEEVRKLYDRCWGITCDILSKRDIDTAFLLKMREPDTLTRIYEVLDDPKKSKKLEGWQAELFQRVEQVIDGLNDRFAERNGLPKKISSNADLKLLSKYIEEKFGSKLNLCLMDGAYGCNTDGLSKIVVERGMKTIDVVNSVLHEESHLSEKFAVRLKRVAESTLMRPGQFGSIGIASFYSEILNIDKNELWKRHQTQKLKYSFSDDAVFIIQLYKDGVYKPANEEMKKNLEFSKFYLDKDMRRAYRRYMEGRAYCAELGTLESSDETLRAEGALEIILKIPAQGADFFAGSSQYHARGARDDEAFRYYYTLQQRVGAGNLKKLEEFCAEKELVPGVDKDGRLVVIDTKEIKMHRVDAVRLSAGVIVIEREEPKLPERMG